MGRDPAAPRLIARCAAPFVGCETERQPHMGCGARASCYPAGMTDQALNAAVARLERAVEHAERATRARESASGGIAESYALLQERHMMLRQRVEETIGRLDTLIAGEGAA